MPPHPHIVITGAGLACCLGLDLPTAWLAVRRGDCGVARQSALEQPLDPDKGGGQAPDLPVDFHPGASRESRYLRWILREAWWGQAGIRPPAPLPPGEGPGEGRTQAPNPSPLQKHPAAPRVALILGTTLHGMRAAGRFLRTDDPRELRDFRAASAVAALQDELLALGGPRAGFALTTCSACSSALAAVALGMSLLRAGAADLVIAGGYDTVTEYVYAGFNSLRLVASGPQKPFAKDRAGMKVSEGYALLVLERGEDAQARGAAPIARVLGIAETSDAHHLTQPHPQGEGAARAIAGALREAGLTPADVGLASFHATATPDNDAAEFAAYSQAFGPALRSCPAVAFKSHVGHTLGGAGAVELLFSAMAMRDQVIPPTANTAPGDLAFPDLQLNLTGRPRPAAIHATLNTSLGFGGANAAIVLGSPRPVRMDAGTANGGAAHGGASNGGAGNGGASNGGAGVPARPDEPSRLEASESGHGGPLHLATLTSPFRHSNFVIRHSPTPVLITGIGVILPGAVGADAFLSLVSAARAGAPGCLRASVTDEELGDLLNARRARRMSPYVKLALASAQLALRDAGLDAGMIQDGETDAAGARGCAILGTNHGATSYCESYYRQIVAEGVHAANPLLFAEGVPNVAGAHLSMALGLRGGCQVLIGSRTAGLDAVALAALRIASGEWDRALVGAAEEATPLVERANAELGLLPPAREGQPRMTAGGVTLLLESPGAANARGARAHATVDGCASASGLLSLKQGDPATSWRHTLGGAAMVSVNAAPLLRRIAAALVGDAAAANTWPLPESFSVGPLAALAHHALAGAGPAAVLAADCAGTCAAVRVSR